MPRGYPDTVTCPNCRDGCPAEWNYCPMCGEELHKKLSKERVSASAIREKTYKPKLRTAKDITERMPVIDDPKISEALRRVE